MTKPSKSGSTDEGFDCLDASPTTNLFVGMMVIPSDPKNPSQRGLMKYLKPLHRLFGGVPDLSCIE